MPEISLSSAARQAQPSSAIRARGGGPPTQRQQILNGNWFAEKKGAGYPAPGEIGTAYAAGASERLAALWMKRFITVAHITFLRMALSFTARPWANIPSSAF